MRQIQIDNTDLSFSAIGLGCAAMGRDPRGWGPVEDNESIATIGAAIDLGANWLDTSPAFGAGHSEEVVGRALQDRRQQVQIVTKCGFQRPVEDGPQRGPRSEALVHECEASLRRLRTDHIDLYMCETPDANTPLDEILAAMARLLEQGKVRAIGVVSNGCDVPAAWRDTGPLHAVLSRLNLLEQDTLRDLASWCVRSGVTLLACGPLCRGLLSGRYSPFSRYTDLRSRDPQFQPPRLGLSTALLERLRPISTRGGRTLVQFAAAWALCQSGVSAIAIGAKRVSQIRELIGAADTPLAADDLTEIASLVNDHQATLARSLS